MPITPRTIDGSWYTMMYLVKNPSEGSMWFEEKLNFSLIWFFKDQHTWLQRSFSGGYFYHLFIYF